MREDQDYVIDLCDEILGIKAKREHTFQFLLGDPDKAGRCRRLPVDAYYEPLKLVVEYRERQHNEAVPFFDRKATVSGCDRGTQRRKYDRLRREVLPQHGIRLVEIDCIELLHNVSKRLLCDSTHDKAVIAKKLGIFKKRSDWRRR